MLTLRIPVSAKAQPRKIEIKGAPTAELDETVETTADRRLTPDAPPILPHTYGRPSPPEGRPFRVPPHPPPFVCVAISATRPITIATQTRNGRDYLNIRKMSDIVGR